jgi:large subunit ribosomal protein L5
MATNPKEPKETKQGKQPKGEAVKAAPAAPRAPAEKPRLRRVYEETLRAQLYKELNLHNINEVPRLSHIVVSMGVGEAKKDQAILQDAVNELALITGQRPHTIRARKSVSNFQIRAGMPIGCAVTLRGNRMYDFFERLLCVALPRIRDFRGVSSRAFDGRGNYSLGLADQLVFPELDPDKVKRTQGMNVAIVTTARTDDHGRALLRAFGMPFMSK